MGTNSRLKISIDGEGVANRYSHTQLVETQTGKDFVEVQPSRLVEMHNTHALDL